MIKELTHFNLTEKQTIDYMVNYDVLPGSCWSHVWRVEHGHGRRMTQSHEASIGDC